jgi:aminoglycoside phosphotransferase (APT) family kinase protein
VSFHSPSPTTIVGTGLSSEVFAWGEGRVLKLFHKGVPASKVEQEFKAVQALHAAGLPVPATYERLAVQDRLGIVFERVPGRSMYARVQAKPWTLFRAARQLADLHAQIHSHAGPIDLPPQRQLIEDEINQSSKLSAAQKQAAQRALGELPDGNALCHGDFHPGNVFFTARGPVIIDWERASRGDPQGDVACTSRLIQHSPLPEGAPKFMHLLLSCTRRLVHRIYLNQSLQLHAATRQQIEDWASPLAAAAEG